MINKYHLKYWESSLQFYFSPIHESDERLLYVAQRAYQHNYQHARDTWFLQSISETSYIEPGGGGHSHMEVTGMCGHDPQSRGLSVTD